LDIVVKFDAKLPAPESCDVLADPEPSATNVYEADELAPSATVYVIDEDVLVVGDAPNGISVLGPAVMFKVSVRDELVLFATVTCV
jgi:hypothetical protein